MNPVSRATKFLIGALAVAAVLLPARIGPRDRSHDFGVRSRRELDGRWAGLGTGVTIPFALAFLDPCGAASLTVFVETPRGVSAVPPSRNALRRREQNETLEFTLPVPMVGVAMFANFGIVENGEVLAGFAAASDSRSDRRVVPAPQSL